jgi:uncharacterized protein YndB with AHSA1/START domain
LSRHRFDEARRSDVTDSGYAVPVAINEIGIDAPPERVFAVLADWRSYGEWVVGSSDIRGADPGFPAAGTRFHHTVGIGPLKLPDHTQVVEVEQPHRLVLRAKSRPLATAIVAIELSADGNGGTHAKLREDPGDPLSAFVFMPLTHLLVRHRNEESLRRLKELAESRPDYGRAVDVPPGKVEP